MVENRANDRVAPTSLYVAIVSSTALFLESELVQNPTRRQVSGVVGGPDAVEPERLETEVDDERCRFGPQAPPPLVRTEPIAKAGTAM